MESDELADRQELIDAIPDAEQAATKVLAARDLRYERVMRLQLDRIAKEIQAMANIGEYWVSVPADTILPEVHEILKAKGYTCKNNQFQIKLTK